MPKILIIDDDYIICKTLVKKFTRLNHEAHYSLNLKQGLEKLFSDQFDIVFLDVILPDGNGLEAIEIIKDHPFTPEIIIMTGDGNSEGVELAIKSKVWDYIQKNGSHKEFQFSLNRALEYRHQKQSEIQRKPIKREAIIGNSRQIKICLETTSKASNNDVPILITGETGTGKELFAKAIHKNSVRQQNNFIVVDCAALPEHLVESFLFGHSKGAFTSADSDKVGLIKLADGGTLFLDEVGELPLVLQKKFLRALQEKKFRPVGSKKEISSNFRLVSATHRNLRAMVKKRRFREDFYFRIASIKMEIPPLRDRKSDIALLLTHHMNRKEKIDGYLHNVSDEFVDNLLGYDWPGNVRELLNTIDYACSDAFQESILFSKHLPDHIRAFNIKNRIKNRKESESTPCSKEKSAPVERLRLKEYMEKMKQQYVTDLMSHTRGDIKTACRLSGLSRGHLYALLKKYNISGL
ncbi:sigma-54-dependent transcriptional regulator [Desulfobacula toluolica]|uniref:Sigma-54 dependent DNA-binding response regulator n=1 Tax=Desulfobacula toluolica (strain DSM 7467 / Tol2) TaxID=651182 RepID=K0NHJ0_DESTT|nr:sigma-54 dependent transcriptional regulator [Desulfobacula toluolica]CCK78442.1 sigma-54 dependent DNA-binding response regulator [Desulfobacula toluolica Tol2]